MAIEYRQPSIEFSKRGIELLRTETDLSVISQLARRVNTLAGTAETSDDHSIIASLHEAMAILNQVEEEVYDVVYP